LAKSPDIVENKEWFYRNMPADHPDNLVTVCHDCHDEIEGPADGSWERVVEFKDKIRTGRIAWARCG
jgi:hypothetical protein